MAAQRSAPATACVFFVTHARQVDGMLCFNKVIARRSAEGAAGPGPQYMQFPREAEINLLLVEHARAAAGAAGGSRVADSAKASTSGGGAPPASAACLGSARPDTYRSPPAWPAIRGCTRCR